MNLPPQLGAVFRGRSRCLAESGHTSVARRVLPASACDCPPSQYCCRCASNISQWTCTDPGVDCQNCGTSNNLP